MRGTTSVKLRRVDGTCLLGLLRAGGRGQQDRVGSGQNASLWMAEEQVDGAAHDPPGGLLATVGINNPWISPLPQMTSTPFHTLHTPALDPPKVTFHTHPHPHTHIYVHLLVQPVAEDKVVRHG